MNHRGTETQSMHEGGQHQPAPASLRRGERDPLTQQVIGAAIEVHRELGPGLLESAYEQCLCWELSERGLPFERQVPLPVIYKGHRLDVGYRIDLVVRGELVVELKAVEAMQPVHEAQLLTYLKLSDLRKGLLFNFHGATLKDHMKRMVL
jgi:GxxExxY protein